MSIKIDPEFKSLIPPLSPDEYKQLEDNCVAEGIRDPLVVWELDEPDGIFDSILIDGHNRFEISTKHGGILFNVVRKKFSSRNEVMAWIIQNQFGRRNLSAYDRSVLALKLKPLIAAEAKERMTLAPQKKAERDKEIQKIWDSYDFDTARNLVAAKKRVYAYEDRSKTMASEKYIYFARFDSDKVKVGSSINPDERVKQLSVSCPNISLIEAVPYGEGAAKHENALKTKYSQYRIGNECYQCSDQVLSEMIAFTRKEAKRKDNTDYKLAKAAGVSHDTIHKVEKIEAEASEKTKQAIRDGDISINHAFNNLPSQRNKDIVKEAKRQAQKEHLEYLEEKASGTVSIESAKKEKSNMHLLSLEASTQIHKIVRSVMELPLIASDDAIRYLGENMKNIEYLELESDLRTATSVITKLRKELEQAHGKRNL